MMMTSTYSTAAFTTNEDLIDFGVTANNNHYQQASTTDLILLDDNMTLATTPSQTSTAMMVEEAITHPRDNKVLEERDDVFVNSLPAEIIEEQKRIYAEIERRSNRSQTTSNNDNDSKIVLYNPTNYQQQFENKFTSLPDNDATSNSLPAEIHPRKNQMKEVRKVKTAASATTGAVVGGLMFGPFWPVGAVAGATVAGYGGKVIARHGERKQQIKWDKKNFNEYTAQGIAAVQSEDVAFA
mgnify:CR=1 FL=1